MPRAASATPRTSWNRWSYRTAHRCREETGRAKLSLAKVEELLGVGNQDAWLDLARQLLEGDVQAALASINEAAWGGADPRQQHRHTLDLLREAMLLGWGGDEQRTEFPEHIREVIRQTIAKTPRWRLIETARIWGEASLRYDAPSTLPLEIAAIHIGSMQRPQETDWVPTMDDGTGRTTAPAQAGPAETDARTPETGPAVQEPDHPTLAAETAAAAAHDAGVRFNWRETASMLRKQGSHGSNKTNLGALLRGCNNEEVEIRNETIMIPFHSSLFLQLMQKELLRDETSQALTDAIRENFGRELPFRIFMKGDEPPEHPNTLVQEAIRAGFRIISDTEVETA